jgi:hypothetical protein
MDLTQGGIDGYRALSVENVGNAIRGYLKLVCAAIEAVTSELSPQTSSAADIAGPAQS